MTWTAPTPNPVDGPLTGADRPILEGYLGWQRTTLLNICAGLTGAQLATRPLTSSNLSLLGLIRHAAKVERIWFRQRAAGQPIEAMYDPARGKDADFDDIDPDQAEADFQRLQDEWRLADEAVAGMAFRRHLRRWGTGLLAAHDVRPSDRRVRAPQRPRRPSARAHRRSYGSIAGDEPLMAALRTVRPRGSATP